MRRGRPTEPYRKWRGRTFCGLPRSCRGAPLSSCGKLSSAREIRNPCDSSGKQALLFLLLLFRYRTSARPWLSRGPLKESAHRFVHCNKVEAEVAPAGEPVLEGGERAGAIIVELAVIAVVKAKHIAGCSCPCAGALRRVPQRASGDGLHPADEPFHRPLEPIAGNECPHGGLATELVRGRDDPRIAE